MFHLAPFTSLLLLALNTLPAKSSPITHRNNTILTFSPPICVRENEHEWWATRSGPTISVNDCVKAMNKVAQQAQENFFTDYDFYSSPFLPSPFNGYPLPQGGNYGGCSVVIRMTREFTKTVLPTADGGFVDPFLREFIQRDTWSAILTKLQDLFTDCVVQHSLYGYILETPNIAIAIWPKTSIMEEQFGLRARATWNVPDRNTTAISES